MNFGQAILEAIESLNANKTRSGLTILGIVIGVAAVIAMLAVGNGAQNTITGSISGLGSNLLFVFRGNFSEEVRNPKPLTQADADAIADQYQAPSVAMVAPVISNNLEVTFAGEKTNPTVNGVTPSYEQVRNLELFEGEFINEDHILGLASVAIIGTDVADSLFGHRDGLIGETIRIEGQPFRIIGVLQSLGGSAF
ncbi:MAG: ABC transporter permease, partial [Anaerolineaceae bacterium]|nr:ABC transporter permease [Anaerolineaceae bacterium]